MAKKRIAILGSTGSIGTQAIDVILKNADRFSAEVLVALSNSKLLIEQAKLLEPNMVVIADETKYPEVKTALAEYPIKVFSGAESVKYAASCGSVDIVLTAMVGFAGLEPTIAAIEAGKVIALANKETLVVAGDLITRLAKMYKSPIIPVDSEHSAIFQCIVGENYRSVEKLILTASGGPFRGMKTEALKKVSAAQALQHPRWNMGPKVTIDSASLMNKGLEVIEAHWLFGIKPGNIEVVIHPQSIVHSMVQFNDGSIKAQLSLPDMKMPIHYAFSFPERIASDVPRLDFASGLTLNFEKPDTDTFSNLKLAYEALKQGGNIPCAMNAANEVAVSSFLEGRIDFTQISEIIENTMSRTDRIENPDLNEYIATDTRSRAIAHEIIKTL